MEWALLCDGVAKADVYDVLATDAGQDRALASWTQSRTALSGGAAGADTPQLLADGEIVMGSTYNGRLFSAIEEQKQPIGMLWDAQVFDLDGWIIPAGLSDERKSELGLYLFCNRYTAPCGSGKIHLLWSCTGIICTAGW